MLRRTAATRSIAGWIVALIVLNPMVAFMSSGVNPDAVSFRCRRLRCWPCGASSPTGSIAARALMWLLAAALVKPSAGALFIGLASGIGVLWLARRWRRSRARAEAEPDGRIGSARSASSVSRG